MKKEAVAIILDVEKHEEFKKLTGNYLKSLTYFGGKYRLIDFSLSNCCNSNIDTVGVITNYDQFTMSSYLGTGAMWNLENELGGIGVISPRVKDEKLKLYEGTTEAIYENLNYIDLYDPEYVIILSGECVYEMDYSLMIKYHKERDADVTMAVREVPWNDIDRFSVVSTYEDGSVYELQFKGESYKNNIASMGVYIFNYAALKEYLITNDSLLERKMNIEEGIIMPMLKGDYKICAFSFSGYFNDIKDEYNFWKANMEVLEDENGFGIFSDKFKINSLNLNNPPHYIKKGAIIKNSIIGDGCVIEGNVINSVVSPGAFIGKNAKVINSVIMPNAVLEEEAQVEKSIVSSNFIVKRNSKIGNLEEEEITVIS